MYFKELYETLQGLKSLDLLDDQNNLSILEKDFGAEFLNISNFNHELFHALSEDNQLFMLKILDFFETELTPIIDKSIYEDLVENQEDEEEFQVNIDSWEDATYKALPYYDEINNLNTVKLWNHVNKNEHKTVYEQMAGIPTEVTYNKGIFSKVVSNGKDITQNAMYFDGMVKELDEQMDCIVTGVTTISDGALTELIEYINSNNLQLETNVESISMMLKNRDTYLLEHITFIADNIHITKIHHSGENVV